MAKSGKDGDAEIDHLLDRERLNEWIRASDVPGTGPITSIEKLRGGLANAVFRIERGDVAFILRRPPASVSDQRNRAMLREARILQALAGSDVPHPEFYAVCDDTSVIGACFYLMEPLEGAAPQGELQGNYASEVSWRNAMGPQLVSAAAKLGSIDPETLGLSDFGKPDGWHERQVVRWRSQLEGYATTPGYDPRELPHVDEVGRWLSDNLPDDRRIGIIHGDFQFPNVMFSLEEPKITGVIDWELSTLGDPLLDLGWILASWWEESDPPGKNPLVTPWDGFMSRRDLVRRYGEITGRDMGAMPWFFTLACYKLACILEGTYAASKAGKVPETVGAQVHAYATWLMAKADQLIVG